MHKQILPLPNINIGPLLYLGPTVLRNSDDNFVPILASCLLGNQCSADEWKELAIN